MPRGTNFNTHSDDSLMLQQLRELLNGSQLTAIPVGASFSLGFSLFKTVRDVAYCSGTRRVNVSVRDAQGRPQKWYNLNDATLDLSVTTAGDGDITQLSPVFDIVEGEGSFEMSFTGTWATGDSITLNPNGILFFGTLLPTSTNEDFVGQLSGTVTIA